MNENRSFTAWIEGMVSVVYLAYLRPVIKWFLRVTTRLSELQRICYGQSPGAQRTCAVETALELSRSLAIREAIRNLDDCVENGASVADINKMKPNPFNLFVDAILHAKKIKRQLHIQFVHSFRGCSEQIWGYKRLLLTVEVVKSTPYDDSNPEHEAKLMSLWSGLQPDNPLLTRHSKQWGIIGFQGKDPKTDFRGMGMLGLENLLYFVETYPKAASHILSHSHHPQHGYGFAIVGINITHMAYRLLAGGQAKSHMYNVTTSSARTASESSSSSAVEPVTLENFHHFYCYLFIEFDKFWMDEKPETIMEFNRIRDLFESMIKSKLADPRTCFKINLAVDIV